MLLAFDACGESPSIALAEDGQDIAIRSLPPGRGQADQLPALLAEMINNAEMASLTSLATSTGPGSYTGLRACLSLVKGLALVRDLPVYGLSAFECLTEFVGAEEADLVFVDAGRGRVWGQLAGDPSSPILPVDACLEHWNGQSRLVGDAAALAGLPASTIDAQHQVNLDAGLVARIATSRSRRGIAPSCGRDILPLYLRRADAQLSAGKSLLSTVLATSTEDKPSL